MINMTSTSCKHCMVLIRIIVLKGLIENVRIFARHVEGVKNVYANSLSRNQIPYFLQTCKSKEKKINYIPTQIPERLWPVNKVWFSQ